MATHIERVFFAVLAAGLFSLVAVLYFKLSRLKGRFEEAVLHAAIYKAVPGLLFCKNSNGVYTHCNRGVEDFTGCAESEIAGKTASELWASKGQFRDKILETDAKVLREKSAHTVQEWLTYPDGEQRLIEFTKVPLLGNGTVMGLLAVGKDITELNIAKEKAQNASKSKSAFLAHISHEIRNSMNAIIGMTELILRDALPKQSHENALIIKQSGINLLSMINDILDFSKMEVGKLAIVQAEYAFSSLINDVINTIRARFCNNNVQFIVNIDCNIPDRLIGDDVRVRQILWNLLSNAFKYTDEGYISLNITGDVKYDSVVLAIHVSDTGAGIKEELLDSLFDDFVQLDPGKNKKVEGTGLGLAITRALCSLMNGEITVKSEYGVGSTFTVIIPQQIAKVEQYVRVEHPEQKSALFYEPRARYADSIERSLANLGINGAVVGTRSEFLKKLTETQFSYVFVASFLFEVVKTMLEEHQLNPRLVLMTEFGEYISSKTIRAIPIPVYSLPIANVMNDSRDGKYHPGNDGRISPFTAPAARVLVVDDLGTNLKVAEGLLAPYKIRTDTCKSGGDAVNMAKSRRYDIIFMDHMMPEMDGIEAAGIIRSLKEENGHYAKAPIIALTANAVPGMKEIFLQSGFTDLLPKPVEPLKLYGLLDKWIPQDKREQGHSEDESIPELLLMEIDGIDITTGISLNGGKIDNYIETLAIFHKEGLEKANEIRNCLKHNDIKKYTVLVHALKSGSRTIGAISLSDFARTLEIAGKNESISFIVENTEAFLAELETLLANIHFACTSVSDSSEFDLYKNDDLSNLKTALEHMNAGKINSILSDLSSKAKGRNNKEIIHRLSQFILEFDYDEAVKLIDSLQ